MTEASRTIFSNLILLLLLKKRCVLIDNPFIALLDFLLDLHVWDILDILKIIIQAAAA